MPAPPAAPVEDPGVDPGCGSDLQAICDAYRRATGFADLCPEALRAIAQRRALSTAYVAAKLALLRAAMAAGEVRQARGYFLAALDRDWTEQPRPADRRGQQDTARQDPAAMPPDDTDLVAALVGVGVTPEAAARLIRDNPDGARRQLRWLPQRKARDPAAMLVRAIAEDWPEPPSAREDRLAAAARVEAVRWSAEMDRAREEATRPESRQVGREALAERRRMLGLENATSANAMPAAAPANPGTWSGRTQRSTMGAWNSVCHCASSTSTSPPSSTPSRAP